MRASGELRHSQGGYSYVAREIRGVDRIEVDDD
jgi:hypothetical protein